MVTHVREIKDQNHFLDHLFSKNIIFNTGSGIDDINIVSWQDLNKLKEDIN